MAEETGVEDVGNDENIGLCHIEVLSLVEFEHISFKISSLSLTICLPHHPQKPISNTLNRYDNPLDLVDRTDQSQYQPSCQRSYMIIEHKSNQTILTKRYPSHRYEYDHR